MTGHNAQPNPLDARYGAYEILQRVEEGGYADRLLDGYLVRHPGMDPRERGLLTELVYGLLRLRGRVAPGSYLPGAPTDPDVRD